ncbi:hypothetical protein HFP15_19005 [Amycolatopsis sp. K13G38]|uniref:Uncharacterized protein n=1 Tax=Amycolatopsis acididurans TaxID=2724524 RepID=A0ABX1J9C0_9PSEU|nr:hypothetical protein [Amycolatopsis acididurans]NKQ54976.1 hypothetical protein [Amycolatopsis acididurans]
MTEQVISTLVGGGLTLLGVLITAGLTGRRERKNRSNVHLSRLLDRRYDLYLAYLDVMTRNASLLRGEDDPRTPDVDGLYVELARFEERMQAFASHMVLGAFEEYRECIRNLLSWNAADEQERARLLTLERAVHTLSLAAIREDLGVEGFEPKWRRRRIRRAVRLFKRKMEQNSLLPGPTNIAATLGSDRR